MHLTYNTSFRVLVQKHISDKQNLPPTEEVMGLSFSLDLKAFNADPHAISIHCFCPVMFRQE